MSHYLSSTIYTKLDAITLVCYEIIEHSIKGKDVIKFLDDFSSKLERKTVVILDQASIHTSNEFVSKLAEWR